MKKLFIALGIGGIAFGLYSFYLKQLEILEMLRYRLAGLKLKGFSLSNVKVEIIIEVINDSDISVTITDYYFDIYVNKVFVGNITNAKVNQKLKKLGGASNFNLMANVSTSALIGKGVISGLQENFKNSSIRIKGNVGVKKGLVKLQGFPIDESFKVREFI